MRISRLLIGWGYVVPNAAARNTAIVTPPLKSLISRDTAYSLSQTCSSPAELRKMAARTAKIERKTNETQIEVFINLDCQPGSGNAQEIEISTGIGFLDHVRPFFAAYVADVVRIA